MIFAGFRVVMQMVVSESAEVGIPTGDRGNQSGTGLECYTLVNSPRSHAPRGNADGGK